MTGPTQATDGPKYADAVLEGGGVRGIGHVGAVSVAEKLGYQWVNIAGTSAGAIVTSMMAAGYNAAEMYEIMKDLDYSRFADYEGFDWFVLDQVVNMIRRGGIHPGKYLEDFMRSQLAQKGKHTFGDLIVKGQENDPRFRYRLTVIASDISTGRMVRLPHDAREFYGLDPDDFDIARAVRMSASYPFFFIPVEQQNTQGNICRIIDGGMLSNFPVEIFDVSTEPAHPTFGFRFVDALPPGADTQPDLYTPTNDAFQILQAMLSTVLSAHDRLYLEDHNYVRTTSIPVNGISALQFDLSKEQAETLYQNGQKAAEEFFATWDFDAYKATYRSDTPPPTRLERLHTDMQVVLRNSQQLTAAN